MGAKRERKTKNQLKIKKKIVIKLNLCRILVSVQIFAAHL